MAAQPYTFRSVFISDLHLGSVGCKCERIIDFLGSFQCENLYLVGDIVDLWVALKKGKWTKQHTSIVRILLDKSKNNCTIFLTPGNHDAFLRKAIGIDLGNIFLDDHFCHETADGQRLLVIHGDQFDKTVKFLPLAMLGTWMFEWVSVFNAKRSKLKGPGSKVGSIKKRFKKMISSLTSFEDKLAWQASLSGFDGVVCGHIHRPEIRDIDEIKYCNTGDWVENCTAIVEHEDGRLELLNWDQISKMIQDVHNSTGNLAVIPSEVP